MRIKCGNVCGKYFVNYEMLSKHKVLLFFIPSSLQTSIHTAYYSSQFLFNFLFNREALTQKEKNFVR